MDDVLFNKAAIIERCVARVHEEYANQDDNLTENITKQDAVVLNILRACEAAIDLAMHLVRVKKLGVPQESRDVFQFLIDRGDLESILGENLQRMVGFRNIGVYDYQKMNLDIVRAIIQTELDSLLRFSEWALRRDSTGAPKPA